MRGFFIIFNVPEGDFPNRWQMIIRAPFFRRLDDNVFEEINVATANNRT
jgi:hypothetical protein